MCGTHPSGFKKHFILSIIQFDAYEMTVAGAVWEIFPI